ncbi:hypothetical protein ACHAWT_008115 [Skeletonema menzelii]
MAEKKPVKVGGGGTSTSDFISSDGYRQDISRSLSNLIGDDDNDSISSKEEGYQRDDSRDLEDMAEEEGVSNEHKADRPAIARKRVKQRVNPSEEETQIIPLSLGHYIDHSLDPIIDDPPFAPLQRMANFPETLFAILSNDSLSDIITWKPHGRSFAILDRSEFARSVLPTYYRTSRMGSFAKQLNGYSFTKIKEDVNKYTFYHPFFLRGLPHLVKNIKRNASGTSPAKGGKEITEADLERISAEAPLPDSVSATCSAYAAIQRINQQCEINRLREESFEPLQWPQAPVSASFPSPLHTSSSNIDARQLGGPTVNYEPMLPILATSQIQSVAPSVNSSNLLGAYNLPQVGRGASEPPPGWDNVTNALLQAFQEAQAQRQLQDQAQQAQLSLLANALAADLQNSRNTQSYLPYPSLTPSQLGALYSAAATLNSVPSIPSTSYNPTWVSGTVQQQSLLAQLLLQQQQRQRQQQNNNFNDGTNFSQNDLDESGQNNAK